MSEDLEVFIRVVDSGSFSAAARDLGVLPSTISRRMNRLEERLGVRLLHRTTREVAVTQAGSIYYEGGRRIVEANRRLESLVTEDQGDLSGSIRVGVSTQISRGSFARLLAAFMQDHEHARVSVVDLRTLSGEEIRHLDVALWVGDLPDLDWSVRMLCDLHLGLFASRHYVEQYGYPRTIRDLEDHYCVVAQAQKTWPVLSGGELEPDPRLVVPDLYALRTVVAEGSGIGLLTTEFVPERQDATLQRILENEIAGSTPIYTLYPRDRLFSATARAFVEFCVENCKGMMARPPV